jgi:hypothetical protein
MKIGMNNVLDILFLKNAGSHLKNPKMAAILKMADM